MLRRRRLEAATQVPLLLKDGATGHSCCLGPESLLDAAFQRLPVDGCADL